MNKSLAPLIALFALVVLVTLVVVNLGDERGRGGSPDLAARLAIGDFSGTGAAAQPVQRPRRGARRDEGAAGDRLVAEARIHLDRGQMEQAEDKLRTLLVFDPDNNAGLRMLGAIFIATARYPEAEMALSRLARLEPESPQIQAALLEAMAGAGKPRPDAKLAAELAVDLAPAAGAVLLNAARIHALNGDIEAAMPVLIRLRKLMGEDLDVLLFDPRFDNIRDTAAFQIFLSGRPAAEDNPEWWRGLEDGRGAVDKVEDGDEFD